MEENTADARLSPTENNRRKIWFYSSLLFLAVTVGILHYRYVIYLFENDRNFSFLSELEREMSLRTEMGFYYSYYKIVVEKRPYLEAIYKLVYDKLVEYPNEVNALSRFNIYPEVIIGTLYRQLEPWLNTTYFRECHQVARGGGHAPVESCIGIGQPIFFYLETIWWLAGVTVAALFLHATVLSQSVVGGAVAVLQYFANHAECTRVQWAPNERENMAMPLLMLQSWLLTLQLRNRHSVQLQIAIFALNSLCLTFWQFTQFIFLTQVFIFFVMEQIRILDSDTFSLFLHSHFCGLHTAILLLHGNNMLQTSLYTFYFLTVCVYSLFGRYFRVDVRSLVDFLAECSYTALRIGLTVLLALYLRDILTGVLEIHEDDHVWAILYSKFSDFKSFQTLIYTCSEVFDFLPWSSIVNMTKSMLIPFVVISCVKVVCFWVRDAVPRFKKEMADVVKREREVSSGGKGTGVGNTVTGNTRKGNTVKEDTGKGDTVKEDTSIGNASREDDSVGNTAKDDIVIGNTSREDDNVGNTVKNDIVVGNTAIDDTGKGNIINEDTGIRNTVIEDTGVGKTVKEDTVTENTAIEDTSLRNTVTEATSKTNTVKEDTRIGNTVKEDTGIEDTSIRNTVKKDTDIENTVKEDTGIRNTVKEITGIENTLKRRTGKDTATKDLDLILAEVNSEKTKDNIDPFVVYVRNMRIDPSIFYNLSQMAVYGVMAALVMRLKLLFSTQMCLVSSLIVNEHYCILPKWMSKYSKLVWALLAVPMFVQLAMNMHKEMSHYAEFSDYPREELLQWISKQAGGAFAGSMPVLATVLLVARRPVVAHPHFEHVDARERAYTVYKTYGRFRSEHLYQELTKLKATYLIVENKYCYGASTRGCTFRYIWDVEMPSLASNPQLCHVLLTEPVEHFYPVFRNKEYAVFRVHDLSVQFMPRSFDT